MQSIWKKYGNLKALGLAVIVTAAAFAGAYVSGGQTTPGVVKLNPVGLGSDSTGAWVEDSSAWAFFDSDTATAYTPAASPSRIMVNLPLATDIASIKIYGPAAYDLTVYDCSSGSWVAVPGLQAIALRTQAAAWNTFKPSSSIKTNKLMFEFTASSGNAGGIKEIEIWGSDPGDPGLSLKGIKTPADAKNVLISYPRPAHIVDLVGAPQTIDVPADSNSYTINFTLGTDPRLVKRAYLVYDSYNAVYPVSPEKRINGLSWSGGFVPTSSGEPVWTSHIEEINPAWLLKGANAVEFRNQVSGREPASYTISDFKVLAELDNGWNIVSALEGTSGDLTHGPGAACDGDTNTYFELTSANTLDIRTDRSVQPETIKLNLWSASGSPAGKLTIQYLQGSQWKSFASGGILDLATLHDGWNDIAVPAKVAAESLRLAFEVPSDRRRQSATVGGVTEVRLIGSPTGIKPSRGIVLTYPLAGEFFGRTAFLQGFIDPANNGSGAVQVAIEGKNASKPDGLVALSLSKDETRFATQNDNDAWEAAVSASYPDGKSLARTVVLNKNVLNTAPTNSNDSKDTESTARDKFSEKVAPGQAKKIQYKGVTLDIPEGAVDSETEITIIPLTEADLARLNPGMIDVTYPAAGYRFLPHGMKFKKPIKISFGYSKQLLAAGQKDDEVNMYFYDESLLRWQKLSRVNVDPAVPQVTSESDHFTDIINSTLVVPEHPQALSFNPNSIKDIKAADPSANIDLIEPPRANNTGSANLSYPIEIPKGRGAYTPDLGMTYSSGNTNGWMGLGWDIPIPSIQVDTRWGVPTYNPDKETESYLLAGQSVAPVFKLFDEPQIDRQADLRFYKRVEGDFLKIIRKGDKPDNYSWVVTDKSGVKYYYGTTAQARLADYATGNVFQWFLEKVVDTNGNVTVYNYYTDTQQKYLNTLSDPLAPPQNALGGENWVYVYLDSINYTDNEKTNAGAKYSVQFVRDDGSRKDLTVGGKSGFKTAERFRLDSVVVKFKNDVVRSYRFDYLTGDFSKSLLQKVTVTGANGAEFYNHSFGYYHMTTAFAASEPWNDPIYDALTKTDEFTHSHSEYVGYSATTMRQFSKGTLTGKSNTESKDSWRLLDLNGDGLPDIVGEGAVRYNLLRSSGFNGFGPVAPIEGLAAVNVEERWTWSNGYAHYFGPVSWSNDMALTQTQNCAMLKDINGDGFPDLAFGKDAYFNRVATDSKFAKVPYWTYNSDITGPTLDAYKQQVENYRKTTFHLIDPVRKWVAPFAGDIAITGTVQKKKRENALEIENLDGDGLMLSVYRENTKIGELELEASDYAVHPLGELVQNSGSDTITLQGLHEGDRIYFKMNSIDNGENDEIIFDPVIRYEAVLGRSEQELLDLKDTTGRPLYSYQSSADYVLADRGEIAWGTARTGTIAVTGRISKLATTDDIHVVIKKSKNPDLEQWDTVVKDYFFHADETATIDLNEKWNVTAGERFLVTVLSDRWIDPSRVAVSLDAVYENVETCEMSDDFSTLVCTTTPVTNPDELDREGHLMYRIKPQVSNPVSLTVPRASGMTWAAPYSGTIRINGDVYNSATTPVFARILGINKSFWKQRVINEEVASADIMLPITAGDQLFFEIQSGGPSAPAVTWSPLITYTQYCPGSSSCVPVSCSMGDAGTNCTPSGLQFLFSPSVQTFYEDPNQDNEPFGGGFRQWFFGEWNGNNDWDQSVIVQPPDTDQFLAMRPFSGGTPYSEGLPAWSINEDRLFISANGMSSSRLAQGKVVSCPPGGVLRQSSGTNSSNGLSGPIGGTQSSSGSTATQIEFLDFNGDGYPDLVTPDKVILTDGITGLKTDSPLVPGTFRTIINSNSATNIGVGAIVNGIKSGAQTASLIASAAKGGGGGGGGFSIWSILIPSVNFSVGGADGTSLTTSDLIDINGDGLPDLVTKNSALSTVAVRLNLGDRFGAEEQWHLPGGGPLGISSNRTLNAGLGLSILMDHFGVSETVSLSVAKTEQAMQDINGDGLPDMVSKISNDDFIAVRINQGGSFGPVETWAIPSWQLSPPQRRGTLDFWTFLLGTYIESYELDKLMFDNDTLTNSTTESFQSGNFANGFKPIFQKGFRPEPLWQIRGWENASGHSTIRSQIDFVDIDGDGVPDHVMRVANNGGMEVKRNLSAKANMLQSVRRPLGGTFTLDYERKGNTVDYTDPNQIIDMPNNRWVLSQVTLGDGMKNTAGQHVYETSYSYGPGYYNRQEREFYGFRTVAETRGSDMVTVVQTYDNQDYYLKGLLISSVTRSGNAQGPAYVASENQYLTRNEAVAGSRFPYLTKTTTNFYNVQTNAVDKTTSQEYTSYDEYGNILEYADMGEPGVDSDNAYASIRYQPNQNDYIVNRPTSIEVRDIGNRIYRGRSANYYPVTGNLKDLSMLVQGNPNVTWNMTYYPDGNLETIIAPPGDPAHNQRTGGYTLTYVYDPEVQTYATSISDSFGYNSMAEFNLLYGQPAWQKDINNNYQVNRYDDFGRLSKVYGPYDTTGPAVPSNVIPALHFTYNAPSLDEENMLTAPASAVTRNKAESSRGGDPDTLDTVTSADGLKRIIQTKKEADVRNIHGMVVSGTVVFDSLGRVVEQDQPTFVAGMNYAYVSNLSRLNPTKFAYDTLDRTTRVTTPDGAITTTAYGFDTPPQGGGTMFKTTVMDGNNFVTIPGTGKGIKISYKDVHDRIVAVEEHQKGSFIPTKYEYNILGEITKVTDANDNDTIIDYDLLGRRLSIDNKDTGLTTYTYDASDNVTTKETANLLTGAKKIHYVYDYNRLVTINYPDSTDVVYEYGDPMETGDQRGNLAGRIKRVTDESGEELRYYGRLGETIKELRQINAKNNPVARNRYETRYVFDSFGRMLQMVYPDGETLYYVYDGGGLLKQAFGSKRGNRYDYIKNLAYDQFGQRTDIQYGNNVKTTYTYAPLTLRLSHLRSVEPTKGRVIQDIDYGYDMVGNIMHTINNAPVPAGGEIGGPTRQYFTYDDLYQLDTANGEHLPAPGKRTSYANSFIYDIIGNIKSKVQTHLIIGTNSSQDPRDTNYILDYKYTGAQPHAVTDAGDKLYTYDKNGNMRGWTSKTTNATRVITWNEENRVKSIADSGSATEFLYDDGGERAVKGGGGNETVYLNRFYSLKNGDLGSKHIFAGETRVCTKVEKDGGSIQTGVPGSGAFLVSQGIYNALRHGNVDNKRGILRRQPGATTGGTTTGTNPPLEKFEFFYHGDHLGSSSFITDDAGAVYQHLEYFPYGETWVEDGGNGNTPGYKFTGKELDPETGLYYYGARYYDPVLQRWISADPILHQYLDGKPNGGVYGPSNLALYTYTANNPLIFLDPDGLAKSYWQQVQAAGGGIVAGMVHGTLLLIPGAEYSPAQYTGDPELATVSEMGYDVGLALGFYGGLGAAYSKASTPAAAEPTGSGAALAKSGVAPETAVSPTVGELRASGLKDAHHIIQDAAVKDLPGYQSNAAPGAQLPGPANVRGTPHNKATQVQRQAGGGTYAAERRIGYKALRQSGHNPGQARSAIKRADTHFEGLGVKPETPTRIPGNRPKNSGK